MPAVGRVDITAADAVGTAPITSIELSDNGGDPTADDLHDIAAMALANDAYVRTDATNGLVNKVNRDGDTMTDTLEIGVSSANQPALDVTGNGSSPGINAMGGATGSGGLFEAGGGNNPGVSATGAGTGAGATLTGGTTGPGLTAVNGTAQTNTAPTCAAQFAGYVQLTGTDPNSNVDPGANNALHGANVPKAWCTFDTGYNILDGYNVTSLAHVTGSIYKITFARAMANANYAVTIQQHGAPLGLGATNSSVNAGDFEFVLYKSTDGALGFVTSATRATIVVFGRQ